LNDTIWIILNDGTTRGDVLLQVSEVAQAPSDKDAYCENSKLRDERLNNKILYTMKEQPYLNQSMLRDRSFAVARMKPKRPTRFCDGPGAKFKLAYE
jgi:hypothetical protein